MHKFVRSVALILALVMVFSVTVSADETNSRWISFLDYDTGTDRSNYIWVTSSKAVLNYQLPGPVSMMYIQGVLQASGDDFTMSYSLGASETENSLTILPIGNGLYRFYSPLIGRYYSDVSLNFRSEGNTYIDVLSFEYSSLRSTQFAETGIMTIGSSPTYTMSSTTSSVTHRWDIGSTGYYIAHFSCPDWRLYDEVTFFIYAFGPDVHSIVGRFGSFPVPVSVTYLDASGSSTDPRYSIMVTMDLTGLDRNKTDIPQIEISGNRRDSDFQFYLSLLSVTGYLSTDSEHTLFYFFRNLEAHISNLFDDMASRQDAYHLDLQNWQQSHDQLLIDKFTALFSAISTQTNSITTALTSFQTAVLNKITSFQSSMEFYLENLPRRIAEEIAKVFQPTEGKFEAAKDESQELAEEKLGAVYQAATVVDQIAGAFTEQAVQTSISIPVVRIMVLPDVPFEFGGWDVPIVPAGMEFLIDTLKYVIDIVCTLAFLNGMKKRLEGFFGGESGAD